MKKAILATKVGMTQVYNEAGVLVPVTVLQAGPCVVTRVKSEESDGYIAVQVLWGLLASAFYSSYYLPQIRLPVHSLTSQ